MSTLREQIVDAVHTALNTARPEDVPEFVRTRIVSPEEDTLPANTLYQGPEVVTPYREGQKVGRTHGPFVNRNLTIHIEFLVKAAVGDPPADQAADPSVAWATQAIMAAAEDRFGGLVDDVYELGTEPEYDRRKVTFCRIRQIWRFKYHTRTDDPELKH